MSNAYTMPSDMFVPELALPYFGYEFANGLGVYNNLIGTGSDAPIRLVNFEQFIRGGQFVQSPGFKKLGDLTRRDTTSSTHLDTIKISTRNDRGVRISSKYGPYGYSRDAEKQAGLQPGRLEQEFGMQMAQAVKVGLQKSVLNALVGAVTSMTTSAHTHSVYVTIGTKASLTSSVLTGGLAKMGDRMDRINSWVFTSYSWNDLISSQVGSNASGIAMMSAAQGIPATLNRPFFTCDEAILGPIDNGSYFDKYRVLALGPGAIEVELMPPDIMGPQPVLDAETAEFIVRADIDWTIKIPGFQWDSTGGGANPSTDNTSSGSYWTPEYSDAREVGIVLIECNSVNS